MGYSYKQGCKFIIIFNQVLLRMRNITDEICTENQSMFYVHNVFPKRDFCEIM